MGLPVHDENGEIIGTVEYNDNLDYWDGSNNTCGSAGRHKGLTRLKKSGKYVLVHGTQWQGERDSAEVITAKQAVDEILRSGNENLLDEYPELKELMEKELDSD